MIFEIKARSRWGVLGSCLSAAMVPLLTVTIGLATPGTAGAQESEKEETKEAIDELVTGGQSREYPLLK